MQFLLNVQRGKVKGAKVRDRVAAADILLSRGFGKVTQPIEAEVEHTYERPYQGLPPDILQAIIYMTERLSLDTINSMVDRELGVVEGKYEELGSEGSLNKDTKSYLTIQGGTTGVRLWIPWPRFESWLGSQLRLDLLS